MEIFNFEKLFGLVGAFIHIYFINVKKTTAQH